MGKNPSPFRDCVKCGQPVHARSAMCKSCGEVSPWKLPPNPEVEGATADVIVVDDPHTAESPTDATVITEFKEAPKLRVVETVPLHEDFNPSSDTVAAYLSDITAPERAAEAERHGPHVFLERFSCMIGVTMGHFAAGQVVTDFVLLQALKAQNAPMVPHGTAPGMACCPQCKHVFKVPALMPAKRAG